MRSVRTRTLAIALAAGCTDPTPEEVWEGRHVTITSSSAVRPCSGTLEFYDRVFEQTHRYWTGAAPASEVHVRIDFADHEDTTMHLPVDFAARSAVASGPGEALHGIGHLVVGVRDGASTPVLSEGVAEAFGADYRLGQFVPWRVDPDTVLFEPELEMTWDDQHRAASLVSYLIRRYGVAAVREAYQSVDASMNADDVEETLVGTLGADLQDALEDFRDPKQRPCPLQAWECGGEVLAVETLPVVIASVADCRADATDSEDVEVLGAVAEADLGWSPRHMFTLDVGSDDEMFEVDVSENARVYIESCLDSCDDLVFPWAESIVANNGIEVVTLTRPPGRYIVQVEPVDRAAPYGVEIRRARG